MLIIFVPSNANIFEYEEWKNISVFTQKGKIIIIVQNRLLKTNVPNAFWHQY
jgi:hypothetical protein